MVAPENEALCPNCGTVFPVPPGWRLAPCPKCGQVVSRMSDDPAYD